MSTHTSSKKMDKKFSTGTEKKLLKKQELEEEQAFREKVSVPLQARLN